MTVRFVHFSDVHLTARRLGWTTRDLFSKKVTGWVNVALLGRGRRFRHSPRVVAALREDIRTRSYDQLIFSGDATALAFDSELAGAALALGVGDDSLPPAIAVPGNHDYYTRFSLISGAFEKQFAPWQKGTRVDDHIYPFAQRVGHVWLIALNSSRPNWWTFDASGSVGKDQMERLKKLCAQLDSGPRILVTHYPLRDASGAVERRSHRLRDHRAVLQAAIECGVSLWLHGHIHRGYVLTECPGIPFPMICVGSTTQTDRWSYNEYAIDGLRLTIRRRVFQLKTGQFADEDSQELLLKDAVTNVLPH